MNGPEWDFKECAACAAKAGSPTLCEACLHNRELIGRMHSALRRIDALRNDAVGQQRIGFSSFLYPLVAILGETGIEGEGYEEARPRIRTIYDERDEAYKVLSALWEHAEDRVDWFDGSEEAAAAAQRAPELVRMWTTYELEPDTSKGERELEEAKRT